MLPAEILDQITSLSSQHRELLSAINRLSRPSEITSQSVLDELAARIKNGFTEADKAIEVPYLSTPLITQNLELTIDADDTPSVKSEGQIHVAKITEDIKLYCLFSHGAKFRARASFRKVLLQASKTLNQTRHNQAREALFQSPSQPQTPTTPDSSLRQRRPAVPIVGQDEVSVLTAANDVTIALKRTHALLEQELQKSTLSLETLDHSSKTLQQLEHKYGAFDVLLRGSKKLIVELEQADKWDRWMIYGGLLVFGMTCLWIIYKRILRGPLGLVIWGAGKIFGSSGAVSSVAAWSSATAAKVEATTSAIVETRFDGSEGVGGVLWSEGLKPEGDPVTEYVTVTVEVDEESVY